MVVTCTSSSSSCHSFGSFDEVSVNNVCRTVKIVCSHGGRILPRYPDGRLRYVGGETRVLTVDRSMRFSGIQVKLKELCGWESVNLRCQLPTEDLDALISITSDEDLTNLIAEYDLARRDQRFPIKVRAFLHQTVEKSAKLGNPPRFPISQMVPRCKPSFRHPDVQFSRQVTLPVKYSVHLSRFGDGLPFRGHPAFGCHAAATHGLLHHRKLRL